MERSEFGATRTSCGCERCRINCRHMPGFLIPADLDRLVPLTAADPLKFAEQALLASPGALVMKDGELFRIPTLVPATNNDGSCIHLTADGQCAIHANAPFGCAFFDCGLERPGLAQKALMAVHRDWHNGGVYSLIWRYLNAKGRTQLPPEVLRARITAALEGSTT